MGRFDVDCIVVGAGPSGCACALTLAQKGLSVIVLERGASPGEKNVMGGVLYTQEVKRLFPSFPKGAPLERKVVEERYAFLELEKSAYLAIYPSQEEAYTVFRSRFDAWMCGQLETPRVNVDVITSTLVRGVLFEKGRACGVITDRGALRAPVVIGADGVNSTVARSSGLRRNFTRECVILSVKEVLELGRERINARFGLEEGEGVIIDFLGIPGCRLMGGGFIYTCRDHVCIGAGARLPFLLKGKKSAVDLLLAVKKHPLIKRYVQGARTVEFLAHLIPLGGVRTLKDCVGDGVILCGDAMGTTSPDLTGFPFALITGECAGIAAAKAVEEGRFDRDFLVEVYQSELKKRGALELIRDAERLQKRIISNEAFFSSLPRRIISIVESADDIVSLSAGEAFPYLATGVFEKIKKAFENNWLRRLFKGERGGKKQSN